MPEAIPSDRVGAMVTVTVWVSPGPIRTGLPMPLLPGSTALPYGSPACE